MEYQYRYTPRTYSSSYFNPSEDMSDAEIFDIIHQHINVFQMQGAEVTRQYDKNVFSAPQAVYVNDIHTNELIELHNHNFYEINYILDGKMYQYIDGKPFIMNTGDMLIMSPSVLHSPFAPSQTKAFNILINTHFVDMLVSEYRKENPITHLVRKQGFLLLGTRESSEITYLCEQILRYCHHTFSKNSPSIPHFETLVKLLLAQIAIDAARPTVKNIVNGFSTRQEGKKQEIIDYATENFATVTMDELCSRFTYSRMQIYRIFTKCTGYSFLNYISELRINRIRYLLTRSNMSIDEICRNVGLEKPYIFKFFRIRTGTTMLEYRKQKSDENNELFG